MAVAARTETSLAGNVIAGVDRAAAGGEAFEKLSPASGELLCLVARSDAADVGAAVAAAVEAQPGWAARPAPERGSVMRSIVRQLEQERDALVEVVCEETGKPPRDARAELEAAVEYGYFVAGEGRRLYGKTVPSAVPDRQALTLRQPLGVAALVVAANTPLANIAWKVFPALVCGNTAVLKASEHAPQTALAFCRIAGAELPPGVLNLVQGLGPEAGTALVEDPRVAVVSFTGTTRAGRAVAAAAGARLAKVGLFLGGKNALVVCDDADLEGAVDAALLSAFSNAGQRCSSGSRLIVFDGVYERFRSRLVERAEAQRPGSDDGDDFGPLVSEHQLDGILAAIERASAVGATVLTGGERLDMRGFYMGATLVEGVGLDAELCSTELFGPVATLHRVRSFAEALAAASSSSYGLTAAIWTRSIDRAQEFARAIAAGGVQVNGPTYGFEPHVPFGGVRDSGTGWREPGAEALDLYSDWKTVYVSHDPGAL